MSFSNSYSTLATRLRQAGVSYAPAELFGLLCGSLALTPQPAPALVLTRLANHVGEASWPAALVADWRELHEQVLLCYQGEELAFHLLLPEDSLAARAEALSYWCEGFLAGFAESCGKLRLPDNVNEALKDLVAISQMAELEQEGEEENQLLTQIEEHCRLLALTIFTDMALAARNRKGMH